MWKPVQIPQHNTHGKNNKNTDKEKGKWGKRELKNNKKKPNSFAKCRKCEKCRWRQEKSLKLTNDSQGTRQVTRKVTTWRVPSEVKPPLPERWYLHQHLAVTSDTRKVINYAPTATATTTRRKQVLSQGIFRQGKVCSRRDSDKKIGKESPE